jgi:branched-chain amino acid transport system permease protein
MRINRLSAIDALPLAMLILLPWLTDSYTQDLIIKIMIYAILALALELVVGTTGLVCFCQAAFFGIGAYTAVLLADDTAPTNALWLLISSALFASLYALVVGALSLRTKSVYFIMVTLAFGQMAYYVFHDTSLGGGTDGIYLFFKPVFGDWLDLDHSVHFYYVTLSALAIVYVFLMLLLQSRFGRVLAGIHQNEQRMRATGFETYHYKLIAFTLTGAISGVAGFLFAVKDAYVNPQMLSWHMSGAVLVMIIFGGLGSLRGAVLGALTYVTLEEFFKSDAIWGDFARHWHLGLGLIIIASVALLPRGLAGLPALLGQRLTGRPGVSK